MNVSEPWPCAFYSTTNHLLEIVTSDEKTILDDVSPSMVLTTVATG